MSSIVPAGAEGAVVIGKILENDDPNFGFDAALYEYGDLNQKGIIDPLKVAPRIHCLYGTLLFRSSALR